MYHRWRHLNHSSWLIFLNYHITVTNFLNSNAAPYCQPPLWYVTNKSSYPNVSFLSLLPVPPLSRSALSPWWAPQPGTAYLLSFTFLIEPFHLFFLSLGLLCLTVLVLGALLSSFLRRR